MNILRRMSIGVLVASSILLSAVVNAGPVSATSVDDARRLIDSRKHPPGDQFVHAEYDMALDGDTVLTLVGGCMWGGMRDVGISGNYAYAVMHHGLGVFDISDPSSPALAAFLFLEFMWSWNIDIAGDYAYVVDYNGLKIIDISLPGSPYLVCSLDTPGDAYNIALQGDYAYIAERDGNLQIIDISDPGAPSLAGSHATASSARGIVVQDTLVFIADGIGGLRIFDVSDPQAPAPVGFLDGIGRPYDLAVDDTIAYLACDAEGVRVIDVSDPGLPVLVTTYVGSVEAENIRMRDTLLYVSDYNTGLEIINVANPAAPSGLGSAAVIGKVCVISDQLFMIDWYDGLRLVAVSDPENPLLIGAYDTPMFGFDVEISGSYAYGVSSGLHVVDISDPRAPRLAGHVDDVNGQAMEVVDSLAYVVGPDSVLKIFSVANPESPYLIHALDSIGYAYDVAADGDYAFIPTWQDGLVVVDVSDPSAPAIVGNHFDFGYANHVYLDDTLLYMAGITIINVSDPLDPFEEGWYWAGGTSPGDLVVVDTLVYVATGDSELMIGWLEIGSVADPAAPYHIGGHSISNEALDVAVCGGNAFLVDYAGLQAFDVSDPSAPVNITGYSGPGFIGVSADQNHVYVAGSYGLLVFAMATHCGEVNGDRLINIADVVYLINFIFKGGGEPKPAFCAGDADGDGSVNIGDAVHLVSYIFRGGPPPVDTCCP